MNRVPLAEAHTSSADRRIAMCVFAVIVALHLWGVSVGWNSGLLQGNEFRQSQTAVTTLFVQREHNFSLSYPTPVLGKPWSVPMEFPLYQWTVAITSSATGLPLIQAARAVSCLCFYLSLPAIWLLVRRIGLNAAQRWIVLGVVLTCPLYIFYARAFLIETMALMFSLWFLQAFVAAVEGRSVFWLSIANIAGVAAGLVKVTTFMLYLAPAGIVSAMWLWQAWRNRGSNQMIQVFTWIASCVILPFVATVWWIHYADAIKALNPSGVQLRSGSMSSYHFGTWAVRRSSEPWLSHWRTITSNLTTDAGVTILAGLALLSAGLRKWILAALALFLAAPLTFPVLYAWHEYYFVANGVLLMLGFGFGWAALLTTRTPRWSVWTMIVGFYGLQMWGYFHYLYPEQRMPNQGGSGLTRLLRDVTDPQDVIVIAGNDWSSVIPFYAERRALMIRTNLDRDPAYLDQAFAQLADESVPIVILIGAMRENRALLDRLSRSFNIDPNPFLVHKDQTVYVNRAWRRDYAQRLFNLSYNDVAFAHEEERLRSDQPQSTRTLHHQSVFVGMTPKPERYQVPFGLGFGFRPDGRIVFDAHASTKLWFRPTGAVSQIVLEFGIAEEAFTRAGERTDGVEFVVSVQRKDGGRLELFSRLLEPVSRASDRTTQRIAIPVALPAESEVIVETRPGPSGSNAFDWAYWDKIEFR